MANIKLLKELTVSTHIHLIHTQSLTIIKLHNYNNYYYAPLRAQMNLARFIHSFKQMFECGLRDSNLQYAKMSKIISIVSKHDVRKG